MRMRDMRTTKLYSTLDEVLTHVLRSINRHDDPSPECPVCRVEGRRSKMVRDTRRGAICDTCGSRVW